MGKVIEDGASCASIEPSLNSTRQWTVLWGCITAVHWSGRRLEEPLGLHELGAPCWLASRSPL